MTICLIFCTVFVLYVLKTYSELTNDPVPIFPLQLSATVEITAHLIEASSEYPPRTRRMKVDYDYIRKIARIDIEEGYEAAKTYIRRYDQKNEYMIRDPPINDCKRSYLGEVMPFPDITDTKFIGVDSIKNVECYHFIHTDYDTILHIYMAVESGAPVRLVQESMEDGVITPMLTYDYLNVILGPPVDNLFEIPKPFSHSACERHTGGFPYIHIFHYFVRV